jgi:hypothetical protein
VDVAGAAGAVRVEGFARAMIGAGADGVRSVGRPPGTEARAGGTGVRVTRGSTLSVSVDAPGVGATVSVADNGAFTAFGSSLDTIGGAGNGLGRAGASTTWGERGERGNTDRTNARSPSATTAPSAIVTSRTVIPATESSCGGPVLRDAGSPPANGCGIPRSDPNTDENPHEVNENLSRPVSCRAGACHHDIAYRH